MEKGVGERGGGGDKGRGGEREREGGGREGEREGEAGQSIPAGKLSQKPAEEAEERRQESRTAAKVKEGQNVPERVRLPGFQSC